MLAHMGENRNEYTILVVKPEEKISLGKSRYRWENNIISMLKEKRVSLWTGLIWYCGFIRRGIY
jgi:hypothetical protein